MHSAEPCISRVLYSRSAEASKAWSALFSTKEGEQFPFRAFRIRSRSSSEGSTLRRGGLSVTNSRRKSELYRDRTSIGIPASSKYVVCIMSHLCLLRSPAEGYHPFSSCAWTWSFSWAWIHCRSQPVRQSPDPPDHH